MAVIPLLAMVRKDLQLFFSDRRSVIVSFVVPIAIASFFGVGLLRRRRGPRAGEDCDRDRRSGRQRDLEGDRRGRRERQEPEGREADRGRGARVGEEGQHVAVAVVIPKGFGDAVRPGVLRRRREAGARRLLHDPSQSTELAMVRGVMTQHVMEAVSQEMFGGDQGRQLVEKTLPQIQASTTMAPDQKRLLVDMLGSVQKFYKDQPAGGAQDPPRARPHDAVHGQRGSDDGRIERRLQRLRALVRRDGDPVPAVRDGEHRRRDAARAPARAVEPAAQRAGVEGRRCWPARRPAAR